MKGNMLINGKKIGTAEMPDIKMDFSNRTNDYKHYSDAAEQAIIDSLRIPEELFGLKSPSQGKTNKIVIGVDPATDAHGDRMAFTTFERREGKNVIIDDHVANPNDRAATEAWYDKILKTELRHRDPREYQKEYMQEPIPEQPGQDDEQPEPKNKRQKGRSKNEFGQRNKRTQDISDYVNNDIDLAMHLAQQQASGMFLPFNPCREHKKHVGMDITDIMKTECTYRSTFRQFWPVMEETIEFEDIPNTTASANLNNCPRQEMNSSYNCTYPNCDCF